MFARFLMKKGKLNMKNKSILFTGGGTAGHVIVNLALIPYFQRKGWQIGYIGSKTGIERELIAQVPNVTYYPISTGKLRRYISIENLKDPFKVLKGTLDAWRIIGQDETGHHIFKRRFRIGTSHHSR